MKIAKITQTNFKGYENLISHTLDEGEGNNFSFMAMKLNNDNEKDLEIWQNIQKNLFRIEKPDEHIIFHSLHRDGENYFSALDRHLDPKHAENKEDEGLILKAFSLIASLTRRIIGTDYHPENKQIYLTFTALLKNLETITENKSLAQILSTAAAMKQVKPHITAELINKQVAQSMMKYFKL